MTPQEAAAAMPPLSDEQVERIATLLSLVSEKGAE